MEKRRVGKSGLFVSTLGLGTLTWGRDTDDIEAREQLAKFTDAGGTLIDTASTYGEGRSEELLGELLGQDFLREDYIICSKAGVNENYGDEPVVDASRVTLLNTLDRSLKRLGTDYLDIWFVHHFDPYVRVEETVSALEYAISSGRVRYVGVSNFPAWASAEIATLLKSRGLELCVAQNEYSLLQREAEREVLPACKHFGHGFFAWSPLGRGVLTGKYRNYIPADSRAASQHLAGFIEPYLDSSYGGIIEAVVAAAEGLDVPPLAAALTWVKDAPGVTSVLTGARTATQLSTLLKYGEETLPHQIRVALNDVS